MADIQSNINVNINTAEALASIRALQREISVFQTQMAKSNAENAVAAKAMSAKLVSAINQTGAFSAQMTTVRSTTESFTNALEKNKLSMGEYFRYAGGASKTFGKLFRNEFNTINKVARERVKDLQSQYIRLGRDANGAMQAIKVRPLVLDMENLATRTMIAAQRQQLFNQLLKQGSTNLLNFGKNMQWAGRQLMVGFTIPLAMAGTAAARSFMQMEEQALRFKRVYGELFTTQAETDAAIKAVRELANEFTKYGIAAEKTLGLAADAAAMGKMGQDLLNQVTEATRLAVLGGVEQQEALETTISLTNTFSTSVDQLAGKIDFLNAVENQTVVSIEDLTEAIPKAGPVIQQLGGDVEDLAFFLTAMKEGGINASEGANAIKSGLASLINPTKQASDMLAGFGINIKGIVEANAGNIRGTVVQFAQALDQLDPLNRARAIEQLFGKFQFARISTLFNNVVREGTQAQRVLELSNATAEELAILSERELGRVEESTGYRFKKAMEDLKVAIAPIGEEFLKAVTPILQWAADFLGKFEGLSEGTKRFLVILGAAVGAIGPVLLMTFGLIANGAANTIKLFATISEALQRAGQSTNTLGMQTQYMTQEQIEAAAAAASLDQTHQKLIQTFTSEANALNALTAAYTKAIAKQNAMFGGMAPRGGTGGGTKGAMGLSSGIVSVPGPKGKGDIVPAMLTPGEAVIPADKNKKYSALVKGIISGSIPGFEDGTSNVKLTKNQVKAYTNATFYLPGAENLGLDTAAGASRSNISTFVSNNRGAVAAPFLTSMANQMGVTDPTAIENLVKANPKFKQFAYNVSDGIARAVGSSAGNITQTEFSKIAQEQIEKELGRKGKEAYTEPFKKAVRGVMTNITGFEDKTDRRVRGRSSGNALRVDSSGRRGMFANVPFYKDQDATHRRIARIFDPNFNADNEKLHRAHVTTPQKTTFAQMSKLGTLSTGAAAAYDRIKRGVIRVTGGKELPANATRQQIIDEASARRANTKAIKDETGETKKGTKAKKEGTRTQEKATKTTQQAEQAQARVLRGGVTEKVDKAGRTYYTQQGVGRISREQAMALQQRSGGFGRMPMGGGTGMGLAMAGSSIAIGASMMPGKVGEVAQQLMGPIMLLSALPMLFQALKSPLSMVVAGLALAGLAIYDYIQTMKKATAAGKDLANSMSSTSGSIIELSKFTGTVSATEARQKKSAARLMGQDAFKSENLAFGQSFFESDPGKQLLAQIETIRSSGLGSADIADIVGRQLTNAMLQGVLTSDQAKGVLLALGQELGNYEIPLKASAVLNSLVGPDGTNLLRDPFKVAIDLQSKGIEQQQRTFSEIGQTIGDLSMMSFIASAESKKFALGGAIAGAFAGGKLGALIGTAIAPGIGTAVGGVIGTVAGGLLGGAGGGLLGMNTAKAAEQKKLASTSVQLALDLLDQGQQNLDVIEQTYQTRKLELEQALQLAETEKDRKAILEEINRLGGQAAAAKETTLQQNADVLGVLQSQIRQLEDQGLLNDVLLSGLEGAAKVSMQAALDAIDLTAAQKQENVKPFVGVGSPIRNGRVVPTAEASREAAMANRGINAANKTLEDFTTNLKVQVGLGTMSSDLAIWLTEQAKEDKQIESQFNLLVNTVGGSAATELITMLANQGLGAGDAGFDVIVNYVNNNPDEADSIMDTIALLTNIESSYGTTFDFNAPDAMDKILALTGQMQELDGYPDTMTKEMIIEGAENNEVLASFISQWGDLMASDSTISKAFILQFAGIQGMDDLKSAFMSQNPDIPQNVVDSMSEAQYAQSLMEPLFNLQNALGGNNEDTEDRGGSGGKSGSWLDEIVKSSRNFGNAGQELTKGWEDSLNAIMGMVDGVAWATNGLGRQLRSINVPETLIDKFLGMEPEEWEKTKKELFTDIDGKLELNEKGQKVMQAYGSSVIAEKRGDIESQTRATENQIKAFRKLRSQGLSTAEAFDIIQDKKVADAIATNKNTQEVKELIKAQRELTKAQKEYEEISEEQRISEAVRTANKDFAEQSQIVSKLAGSLGKYSEAQINSILNNKDIGKLFLRPNIDKKALETALANANKQADLELKIKKLTVTGQQDIFETGLSAAMSAFAAKEQAIELDFKLKIAGDQSLVEEAQQQISKIQFELDDYQAAIQEIDWAEQGINDAYEKRFEALDRIKEVNDQITASQQKQLDLADALSRGDIAAAAKAAQEMRAQQQEDAIVTQRRMMETAQRTEIQRLRSSSGMTREQLEAKILELEKSRFAIEENTLEPAQERIRLAELAKNAQIADLEVLGKTRDEWDRIANQVDIAQANGWKFAEAMQEALNIMDTLINGLLNKPVEVPVTVTSSGGGSSSKKKSSDPAPAPAPAPSPSRPSAPSKPSAAEVARAAEAVRNLNSPQPSVRGAAVATLSPSKSVSQMTSSQRRALGLPYSSGGMVKGYSFGGIVARYASGGFSMGSDTIPAMLTPGEFVVRRPAVKGFGVDNLEKINNGTYSGGSVYNYNLAVNVKSDANPNEIANTVMRSIKQVEGRRIRGNSYNG